MAKPKKKNIQLHRILYCKSETGRESERNRNRKVKRKISSYVGYYEAKRRESERNRNRKDIRKISSYAGYCLAHGQGYTAMENGNVIR